MRRCVIHKWHNDHVWTSDDPIFTYRRVCLVCMYEQKLFRTGMLTADWEEASLELGLSIGWLSLCGPDEQGMLSQAQPEGMLSEIKENNDER